MTRGTLYIVATPIGNRNDISARALEILKSVDVILAEDTRHAKVLLSYHQVSTRLSAFHAHNEHSKTNSIVAQLEAGSSFALISDAGTPLINDPGFTIVKEARAKQIPVVPIPGPNAFITALSAAGVDCHHFTFLGFLPAKSSERQQQLTHFKTLNHTLICYESTHRIKESIADIAAVFHEGCDLTLAKELTKAHESIVTDTPQGIIDWLLADPLRQKGEFVLLITPRGEETHDDSTLTQVLTVLLAELPLKQAVRLAVKITGQPKNKVYHLALAMRPSDG